MLLSALAGGGLTAVSIGGSLSDEALAATGRTSSEHTGTVPLTVTESGSAESGSGASGSGSHSGGGGQTTSTSTSEPSTSTGPLVVRPAPQAGPSPQRPAVAVQQKPSRANPATPPGSSTGAKKPAAKPTTGAAAPKGSNVALPPRLVAAQAGVLAAELAGSAASVQALAYYRIPLFLLPIYQAAAAQYGVPWQILAAINEIETDYGNDLSVSTAGAVGWMQFMPATWIQYGVDALNAGYADPYNPVDAIFAAARYLRAAGASSNLRAAILAYNHSAEYVSSVLLRAKLISSYPNPVISTLTGLTDGRLPVRDGQVAADAITQLSSPSSATAHATAVAPAGALAGTGALGGGEAASASAPGASPAPSPAVAAAARNGHSPPPPPLQLIDLTTRPKATVVAVQDGRIVKVGASRAIGKYVVLRDVFGDVFTYAGLGSIAPRYRLPKPPRVAGLSAAGLAAAAGSEPAPGRGADASSQQPITLHVTARPRKPSGADARGARASSRSASSAGAPLGKVRLFAHPGNPDALALVAPSSGARAAAGTPGRTLPLRAGAIVAKGTALGHVRTPAGARDGHLRFAIRPAGDLGSVDPRPILKNWSQLGSALHPQGSRGETDLLGATASGVFLLSKADLERDVLSDPGIGLDACSRHDVASGAIDRRVLAVLAFLSRSGLKPTVGALRCGNGSAAASAPNAGHFSGNAVDISAIDGIPIEGHQGPGTVTDVTIRTLLTLRGEFAPLHIISLMQYPGEAHTLASSEGGDHIHIGFLPIAAAAQPSPAAAAAVAHSSRRGRPAPSPLLVGGELSSSQWNQLITHIATLHAPTVAVKRSSSAIPDRPHS
jgi:hypothetical protein